MKATEISFFFLQANAWFIIGLSAIILYLWKKRILTEYYLWKQNRRLTESYAKDKKGICNYSC